MNDTNVVRMRKRNVLRETVLEKSLPHGRRHEGAVLSPKIIPRQQQIEFARAASKMRSAYSQ